MSKDYRGMPSSMSNATDAGNVKLIQTFNPLPWQRELLANLDPILLLSGSAGGGKSRGVAEKIHAACLRYPEAEWVVARKIKDDVLKSAKILLEREVIGKDPRVTFRAEEILYDNGSAIYFRGMRGKREREAIRSIGKGSIDGAWMEEAHEFEDKDFDEVVGRVRGTHMGWSQVILSTNPKTPLHWIRLRLILGKEATVLKSSERDNPYNNASYRNYLANMQGVEGLRLRDGLWVDTTGLVIDTWNDDYDNDLRGYTPSGNVTLSAEYNPSGGPIEIWADDGYAGEFDVKTGFFVPRSHPRVFLLVQETSRNTFNVFYENYATQILEREHLSLVENDIKAHGWPMPWKGIYDSASPSLGKYLHDWGVRNLHPATKNMDDSIRVLRNACAPDKNNVRYINVHPRCKMLRMEMASWTWDEKTGKPGRYQDNGPDAVRYGAYHHIGPLSGESDIGTDSNGSFDDAWELMSQKIDAEYERYIQEIGIRV